MNALATAVAEYVALRRSLGFKFHGPEERLKGFVRFMAQRKATIITYPLALEWATQPQGKRASWALRFSDVRGLSQYLRSREPRTAVLPTRVLPFSKRAKPHLYSDAQIAELLAAALSLPPSKALRRWTYHCLFGLLIVTGLRVGEALALRRTDVDLEQGILRIQVAKFDKSRLVPLHRTTCTMLCRYATRRDALLDPPRSPYFFVAEQGGRLLHQYVYRVFWQISRQIGLRKPSDRTGPRIHDFRHRFAVQTLLRWYRSGQPVEQLLPVLSTYLGHVCVRDTYWYLSGCPELLGQAVSRLEQRWGVAS